MNEKTRIKFTMRTRIALLSIAGLVASFANAGPVDPNAITTFEAGQPARAAEVNANFDALITAINDNTTGTEVAVEVDCADPRDALQQAIDGSDPTKPLAITVVGAEPCGPVAVTRDNVSITNGTIQTDSLSQTPVLIEGARHVVLSNVTIDGQNLAEAGLVIGKGALASVNGVNVSGTTIQAVNVFVQSSLVLGGDNNFDGGSEVGLNIGGNATVFAESGLTTISTAGTAPVLEMDANAVLGGPGLLDIIGGRAEISGNSFLGLENGSIDVATLQVVKSQVVIEVEGDGAIFNLDTVDFNLFGGSRVFLEAQELGTIVHTGNLDVGSNSSLSARGNVVLGRGIPGVVYDPNPSNPQPRVRAQFGGVFSGGEGIAIEAPSIVGDWKGQLIFGVNTTFVGLPSDGIRVSNDAMLLSLRDDGQTIPSTSDVTCGAFPGQQLGSATVIVFGVGFFDVCL
jgi:hypothetical protein